MWPLWRSSATTPAGLPPTRWSCTAFSAAACSPASMVVRTDAAVGSLKTFRVATVAPAVFTIVTLLPFAVAAACAPMVVTMAARDGNCSPVSRVLPSRASTRTCEAGGARGPRRRLWPAPSLGWRTEGDRRTACCPAASCTTSSAPGCDHVPAVSRAVAVKVTRTALPRSGSIPAAVTSLNVRECSFTPSW